MPKRHRLSWEAFEEMLRDTAKHLDELFQQMIPEEDQLTPEDIEKALQKTKERLQRLRQGSSTLKS